MAADQTLIDYYAKLLILQYRGVPGNFMFIQAIVKPVIMNQIPTQVSDGFDLETAVGKQLDVLASYVGVARDYNSSSGPISLSDADLRSLIKFAVVRNQSGSSLKTIQELLYQFFPGDIFLYDYKTMRFSYVLGAGVGSLDLVRVLIDQGLLPKPMGVQLSAVIYDVPNLFGFRFYEADVANISPYNSYEDYRMDRPWLDYADGIY